MHGNKTHRCGNAPGSTTRKKKKRSSGGASSDLRPKVKDYKFKNLVELWEVKATRSLSQVRKLVAGGRVTIEVYQGVVKPLSDRSGHQGRDSIQSRKVSQKLCPKVSQTL